MLRKELETRADSNITALERSFNSLPDSVFIRAEKVNALGQHSINQL